MAKEEECSVCLHDHIGYCNTLLSDETDEGLVSFCNCDAQ